MEKSLIVVSGGMDSITLLYDKKPTHALSFNYGSKHNEKEIAFAKWHCEQLGIPHETIDLDFINKMFKSDLLKSGGDIPEGYYAGENMKKTVVPFRNAIMLSIATGYAASIGAKRVLLGNHAGDHTIYPDCTEPFIKGMKEAMFHGTWERIVLDAPYTMIDKREVGLIGHELGIDWTKTWTCYKGTEIHCGVCGSCDERKYALKGFDPTEYMQ